MQGLRGQAVDRHFLLKGKIALHQPFGRGHKAGLDAVMLAASIVSDDAKALRLVDLGAGVGSAGLCALSRLSHARVVLVENDPDTLAAAQRTLDDPHNAWLDGRASLLSADITLRGQARRAAGLLPAMADHVIMNPPFYQAGLVRHSLDTRRRAAHILSDAGLEAWFRAASSILIPDGLLSVIFRADGLDEVLRCMAGRFGGPIILPLFRGRSEPAIRVIVVARKASRAPLRLLPGIALHKPLQPGQTRRDWTKEASAILNGEATLDI